MFNKRLFTIATCGAIITLGIVIVVMRHFSPTVVRASDEPIDQTSIESSLALHPSGCDQYFSTPPASVSSPDGPASLSPDVSATRRMVMAHASLRTPAVDNPDSPENKAILQSMAMKALDRLPPPAAVPAE